MRKITAYRIKARGYVIYILLDFKGNLLANSIPLTNEHLAREVFEEILKTAYGISGSMSHIIEEDKRKKVIDIAHAILDIFMGNVQVRKVLNSILDTKSWDDIRMRVMNLTRKIPRGRVTTYKSIAKILGIHPRAVGNILKRNPYPVIYPCHRVVKSNGELGGYIGSKYAWLKRWLLEIEGVVVKNGKVEKKYLMDIKKP